jgi:hypothetical protein
MLYIRDVSVTNFTVVNSSVTYAECDSDIKYNIENFDADIVMPNFASPVRVNTKFTLNDQQFSIDLKSSNINDIINQQKGEIYVSVNSDIANADISADYKINAKNPTFLEKSSFDVKITNISLKNIAKYTSLPASNFVNIPNINITTSLKIDPNSIQVSKTEITNGDVSIKADSFNVKVADLSSLKTIATKGAYHNFCVKDTKFTGCTIHCCAKYKKIPK